MSSVISNSSSLKCQRFTQPSLCRKGIVIRILDFAANTQSIPFTHSLEIKKLRKFVI